MEYEQLCFIAQKNEEFLGLYITKRDNKKTIVIEKLISNYNNNILEVDEKNCFPINKDLIENYYKNLLKPLMEKKEILKNDLESQKNILKNKFNKCVDESIEVKQIKIEIKNLISKLYKNDLCEIEYKNKLDAIAQKNKALNFYISQINKKENEKTNKILSELNDVTRKIDKIMRRKDYILEYIRTY